jgi:hypothetical protein
VFVPFEVRAVVLVRNLESIKGFFAGSNPRRFEIDLMGTSGFRKSKRKTLYEVRTIQQYRQASKVVQLYTLLDGFKKISRRQKQAWWCGFHTTLACDRRRSCREEPAHWTRRRNTALYRPLLRRPLGASKFVRASRAAYSERLAGRRVVWVESGSCTLSVHADAGPIVLRTPPVSVHEFSGTFLAPLSRVGMWVLVASAVRRASPSGLAVPCGGSLMFQHLDKVPRGRCWRPRDLACHIVPLMRVCVPGCRFRKAPCRPRSARRKRL